MTDGEFVGAVLYWQWADYIYVEHLFISPEYRGEGVGSRVLDILCRKGRNVILEIDPPVNETALRRMKFYMRNGFRENEYRHVHPPYRDGSSGHELVVMSFPGKLTEKQYGDFNEYLKNTVMAK